MFENTKHPNKFWLMLVFLLAISILLTGCASPPSSPEPAAPPEPTQTPEIILVTEPLLETIEEEDFGSVTWQWIGYRETTPAFQGMIPDAHNYTITYFDTAGNTYQSRYQAAFAHFDVVCYLNKVVNFCSSSDYCLAEFGPVDCAVGPDFDEILY